MEDDIQYLTELGFTNFCGFNKGSIYISKYNKHWEIYLKGNPNYHQTLIKCFGFGDLRDSFSFNEFKKQAIMHAESLLNSINNIPKN